MDPNKPQSPLKPHQNPSQNPTLHKHKKAMDTLKEAIFKISNTQPNGPLSTTQTRILEEHLTRFLSSIDTTPDHPPYAWMIERALQELNEKGGSSEDSISKFIRKEYDNLPWAHLTLLKHHLQKLIENGEVLMIDGRRYVLAGSSSNLNPKRKSKRKRKQKWDWEVKKTRRRHKEKKEKRRVQHDDAESIGEQRRLDEQQNQVIVKGIHGQQNEILEEFWQLNGQPNEGSVVKEDEEENRMIKENGQQNRVTGNEILGNQDRRMGVPNEQGKLEFDGTEEPLQSSVASEWGVGRNGAVVPIQPLRLITTEGMSQLEDIRLHHQKLSLGRVEETTEICNLNPQKMMENKQVECNLPQILCPEAPPGFELIAVEDATENRADNSASADMDFPKEDHVVHQSSERPAEDQAPIVDDFSDALKQTKGSLKLQREQQHQGGRLTKDGSMPLATVLALQSQKQQQSLDTERPDMGFVAEDMFRTRQEHYYSRRQMKRPRRNINKVQEKGTITQNAPVAPSLALQYQQQEQHISDRDRRQQLQLVPGNSSEPKELYTPRKMTRSQLKETLTQHALSTHLPQENSPESKQQIVNPCGHHSVPKPDRTQRQLKRWGNLCVPKPVSTFKEDLLPSCVSADQHLPRTEGPLHEDHTPSTEVAKQQAKLLSRQEREAPQPNVAVDLHDSRTSLQVLEVEQVSELSHADGSTQLEILEEDTKQKLVTQEQSAHAGSQSPKSVPGDASLTNVLKSQHLNGGRERGDSPRGTYPNGKLGINVEGESKISFVENQEDMDKPLNSERASLLSRGQHEEQQPEQLRRRGRPPKVKDAAMVLVKSVPSDHQSQGENEKSVQRGRGWGRDAGVGMVRNQNLDAAVGANLTPFVENHELLKRVSQRKLAKDVSNSMLLGDQQAEQQRRSRGRRQKPILGTESVGLSTTMTQRGQGEEQPADGVCAGPPEAMVEATSEDVLTLNDPQQEVQLEQPTPKRRGRPRKFKEDGSIPGTSIILKNSVSSKTFKKKKQDGRGRGRPRKAQ